MTENVNTETTETEPVAPDASSLNDLARLVLGTLTEQIADYNSRSARLESVTGDKSKATHDLRESSDDAEVAKFRAWLEKSDAAREAAVAKIDAYIAGNLLATDMSADDVAAETESLKSLKSEIKSGESYFLTNTVAKDLENANLLVPKIAGARKSVSKGTGTGGSKPRVSAIYLNGSLVSHENVAKDGTKTVKSTFTDLVKALSETHKVKVETSDIHAAYLAEAGTTDWNVAPDSVEFVYHVTNKAGESVNEKILVTK